MIFTDRIPGHPVGRKLAETRRGKHYSCSSDGVTTGSFDTGRAELQSLRVGLFEATPDSVITRTELSINFTDGHNGCFCDAGRQCTAPLRGIMFAFLLLAPFRRTAEKFWEVREHSRDR